METAGEEIRDMQIREEQQVEMTHKFDNLVILTFVVLLILTLLTCWFFKFRRLSFVHETGLAIIYGLIAGAIVRYTTVLTNNPGDVATFRLQSAPNQTANNGQLAPRTVFVEMSFVSQGGDSGGTANETRVIYQYDLKSQVQDSTISDGSVSDKATFDPELFFNVLLPPIIFYAGYIMKRRHFFRNIGAILTIAFVGTTIAAFTTAAIVYSLSLLIPAINLQMSDALLFGALISATDPVTVLAIFNDLHVDVDLYAVVFGESVLNDVIAIVLAKTVENFQVTAAASHVATFTDILLAFLSLIESFVCSFLIGCAVAVVTSLVTKFTRLRDFPLLETSMFVLFSYSTFVLAEALGLTGIVALLFCGILQAHYTFNNLSVESRFRTRQVFEVLSFLAENLVFVYIGVSTVTFQHHFWNAGFIVIAFIAIIVARALNVYPLCFLLNCGRRSKIATNKQHMLMFVGLRGAMAFALAIRSTTSSVRQLFFSTTLVIVIFTVFVCGGLTSRMLSLLHIRTGVVSEDADTEFDTELVLVRNTTAGANGNSTRQDGLIAAPSSSVMTGETVHAHDAHTDGTVPIVVPGSVPNLQPPEPVGKAKVFAIWSSFDRLFMKPLLTHAQPPLTHTLPACCFPFARWLSSSEQLSGSRFSYSNFENERSSQPEREHDAQVDTHDDSNRLGINTDVVYSNLEVSATPIAQTDAEPGPYRRGHKDVDAAAHAELGASDVTLLPVEPLSKVLRSNSSDTSSLISLNGNKGGSDPLSADHQDALA